MSKVLIVDDDRDLVEACALYLEKEGYEVHMAHSRLDGMKKVTEVKPDLLILDVMMDEADDGIVMAQDLRRGGYAKPILMLTSISKVTGMKYGKDNELIPVNDFQEKPIEPSKLLAKVKELLKK
jgi:DNA-binding response OmpR family regulator